MKERQDPIPVAIYARVFNEGQDMDLPVDAQLRLLRDYAEQNGYVVACEYVDEVESGRTADGPEFRKMIHEAERLNAQWREIFVWRLSRFKRKREHAVAFKTMLRRRGFKVVSIAELADDSPTDKLTEAIAEGVDEFRSVNSSREVMRGMREAASRGFWVAPQAPYGYRKVRMQDGAKTRTRLEVEPGTAAVVQRMFRMAESGKSTLDITKAFNAEDIASPRGKLWSKTMVHNMLNNEAYKGTLIWGVGAKDGAQPVRVDDAFPAIVSNSLFKRVSGLLRSRAPTRANSNRAPRSYLLSGLIKCKSCRRALSGQDAKSGRYSYYVCQSNIKRGKGACKTPRLNARRFEELVIGKIQSNLVMEGSISVLAKLVQEEMDRAALEQRESVASIKGQLVDVRRRLEKLYCDLETTTPDISDIAPRIREHREKEHKLRDAAREAEAMLSERRLRLDEVVEAITALTRDPRAFLSDSEPTERRDFIESFVKEIVVSPGQAKVCYTMPMPLDRRIVGMDSEEVAIPKQGKPIGATTEFGTVTVSLDPRPDAEDRLRRLFALLLEHATRER